MMVLSVSCGDFTVFYVREEDEAKRNAYDNEGIFSGLSQQCRDAFLENPGVQFGVRELEHPGVSAYRCR